MESEDTISFAGQNLPHNGVDDHLPGLFSMGYDCQ
jgi:hypothetical protein